MTMSRIILVTGGLGFIGKHFIRDRLAAGDEIINVDMESYAADRRIGAEFARNDRYRYIRSDISALDYLPECDVLVNFAAESHVDNAITSNEKFCRTNILGVQRLLELCRRKQRHEQPRFVQISTDEVYGDVVEGAVDEASPLKPSNPYSATKAAADMLVTSWARTYGVDYSIIRPTNNYGVHQYPEKLIPKSCFRIARGRKALLHGDGTYKRCWLHVEDTVAAIGTVLDRGDRNEIYNVSGDCELRNIDVVTKIATILGVPTDEAIMYIEDRSGQDVRYAVDDSKTRALGWRPVRDFDVELERIVRSVEPKRFI